MIASYRELTGRHQCCRAGHLVYPLPGALPHTRGAARERPSFERRAPVDVIVQDWQYWGKYGWNAMRFDEDRYPDLQKWYVSFMQ